ncbi:uncharacterized protein LY89DRAFT_778882 [Mollisia scopiformis]|uniref:Zn(2)-C6 fungal-type domain-containing protein n=1 Tax=Mollisia scopiformis TaxID=149040 RepID=A0A194XM44_MOLSC|nr:uncharacterized protein LY89DRAFT_778882 [Mollisia scopiformis]KUJ21315.1 hypothetical protein LY89DRAFT_778882 [Mollisia scopiformis]
MSSSLDGLDWAAIMSPNVQPTPGLMDIVPTPTTNVQPSTSPGARRNENLSTPVYKFQVCSSCRRKKRKCNLERPSCSLCLENGWICEYRHMKKKPGPSKRSGSTVAAASPVVAAEPELNTNTTFFSAANSLSTISENAKNRLVDLYFVHVQPILPLFCRSSFERDLAECRIPNKLIYALFTVSSRFAPLEEILVLLGSSNSTPWKSFARIADQESQAQEGNTHITLNDLKADVLLTLYQFTSFPGRKAWMMVGTLMRTAFAIGLHRIDCGIPNPDLTEFELEEQRFVWWAVWKLDSAINSITGSHFGIDSHGIGTALVSTSVAKFTAGGVVRSNSQFLPTDSSRSWMNAREILTTDTDDGMNMHLLSICFVRAVSLCRQSLHANTTPELIRQFSVLRNALPCMRLSLSEWYFDPSMQSLETVGSHRARLETLLLMHMSQVQCFLPFPSSKTGDLLGDDSVSNWKISVASGEGIATIFRHWKPEYFAVADPFVCSTIWFTMCMLSLHTMSIYGQSEAGPDVKISNALDLLNVALGNFARRWELSQRLLDSAIQLQSWNWLKIDFSQILSLMAQLHTPFDPLKQEPAGIDMWQIVGTMNEYQ